MNASFAFQVTIVHGGEAREVREVSPLYVLLPVAGVLLSIVIAILLLLLLKKESEISKGKRSDLSPVDRTKAICFMGLALLSSLLVLLPLAKIGSFIGLEPVKAAGYALYTLLRSSGLDLLIGAAVLVLHRKNEKKLAQPEAPEQQEKQRRQSAALSKKLRVVMPVMAAAAVAIAAVWFIWFREQRQILLIAYAVYLVVGWIWLTWIILRNNKKDSPEQEKKETDENDGSGSAPDDGRGI